MELESFLGQISKGKASSELKYLVGPPPQYWTSETALSGGGGGGGYFLVKC